MFEQTFKNIDDILHKDAGCGSELDYVEHTSWTVKIKDVDQTPLDLSAKTPNMPEEALLRQPDEILQNMEDLDQQSAVVLATIKELL